MHPRLLHEQSESELYQTVVEARQVKLRSQLQKVAGQKAFIRHEKRRLLLQRALLESEIERFNAALTSDWFCQDAMTHGATIATRLRLQVGQQNFEISHEVAKKDPKSLLAAMIAPDSPLQATELGCFMVDRDWSLFRYILNFLRDGILPNDPKLLKQLYVECDFWKLDALKCAIEQTKIQLKKPPTTAVESTASAEKVKAESTAPATKPWWTEPPMWWGKPSKPQQQEAKKEEKPDMYSWWKGTKYKGNDYAKFLCNEIFIDAPPKPMTANSASKNNEPQYPALKSTWTSYRHLTYAWSTAIASLSTLLFSMADQESVLNSIKSLLYGPPRYFQGVNVGPFFSEEGYQSFYHLNFRDDDIVAITYAKCGTTYLQKLLHLLIHLDDNGNEAPSLNGNGQIYPEWLHHELGHMPFAHVTIDQILNQPSPRVFSTHMRPSLLPLGLKQKGKVVYMLRNPKDAYVSWHFMLSGLLQQTINWTPNEIHQGTLLNYLPGPQNNMMYGDYFSYLIEMEKFANDHLGERLLVVYYEEFLEDFDTQLTKLAHFLGIEMSPKKRAEITNMTSFNTMRNKAVDRQKLLYRKGTCGDWKNYVDTVDDSGSTPTSEQWSRFDEELNKLHDSQFAKPLRKWM